MNSFLCIISKFTSRLAWVSIRLSAAGMVAMTAVIIWQVWGRYVLNDTPDWTERTALLLVLYFALIAAAAGVLNRGHLSIVFLQDMLPVKARFALALASLVTVIYIDLPPLVVFQRMFAGMNIFALLAIPFFIYAGELMLHGGIAERLMRFANAIVGNIRGGLGCPPRSSSSAACYRAPLRRRNPQRLRLFMRC